MKRAEEASPWAIAINRAPFQAEECPVEIAASTRPICETEE